LLPILSSWEHLMPSICSVRDLTLLTLLLCDLPPGQCWSPCTRSLTNPSRP
jgi:hypothetical protein